MQVEGSDPPIKFFLPDDSEYDSKETLDLFRYDLVKMLNDEQNKTLSNDKEMEEDDDVLLEEEYDDDIIICDDIKNLKKKKRKRKKKIFLQTEIDELRNKLHANKYFMEEITLKLVICKCSKKI